MMMMILYLNQPGKHMRLDFNQKILLRTVLSFIIIVNMRAANVNTFQICSVKKIIWNGGREHDLELC